MIWFKLSGKLTGRMLVTPFMLPNNYHKILPARTFQTRISMTSTPTSIPTPTLTPTPRNYRLCLLGRTSIFRGRQSSKAEKTPTHLPPMNLTKTFGLTPSHHVRKIVQCVLRRLHCRRRLVLIQGLYQRHYQHHHHRRRRHRGFGTAARSSFHSVTTVQVMNTRHPNTTMQKTSAPKTTNHRLPPQKRRSLIPTVATSRTSTVL